MESQRENDFYESFLKLLIFHIIDFYK